MNTCPKCEKIILSDYKFCPKCGYSLYGDDAQNAEGAEAHKAHEEASQTVPCSDSVAFFNVAQELSNARNIDHLLQKIGTAVENILDAERSAIMLLDETGENLFFKAASGEEILKKLKVPVGQGVAGWIAKERKHTIVNDPYNDERFSPETDKKTGFTTKSIVGVPVVNGDELLGVVEAINKKDGEFTEQDVNTLTGFAGLAAVSILNTKIKTDQKNFFANMLEWLAISGETLSETEATPMGHSYNMARFAPQIGKELGLPPEKLRLLTNAALLHDIGFLGLNNAELSGIDPTMELPDDAKFKLHPVIGSEMVKNIKVMSELTPYILYHHRYCNGEGFPDNLEVDEITSEYEIIAILEEYYTKGSVDQVDPAHYSEEVFKAFTTVIS